MGEGFRILTLGNMNQNLRNMEFPWPSPVVSMGNDMVAQVKSGMEYPFGEVIHAHAGDPQGFGQKPITFFQQVTALCLNPELINLGIFPEDVVSRAQFILNNFKGHSVGSCSESAGSSGIRFQVAKYIEERDGIPANIDDIFLSSGATDAVRMVLSLVNSSSGVKQPGVMIPCPQYPLFSATLAEYGMYQINYYLDEEHEWGIDVDEMKKSVKEAKAVCEPRALVVINPGNPSGYVLNRTEIEDIIKFAFEENLFLIVDEVYQYNVYEEGMSFISFKKVISEMGAPYSQMELSSFMSGSKGYMGECGVRSGYCELINLDDGVNKMLRKLLMAKLCPTLLGQAVMYCITNSPKLGEPSYETFVQEKAAIIESLKQRAEFVYKELNSMEGMECRKIVGAMYAYPRIFLPEKALEEANALDQAPDELYTMRLLERNGVCVIPGCLFGQKPETYHFRLTFLPQMDKLQEIIRRIKDFHIYFMEKYKE